MKISKFFFVLLGIQFCGYFAFADDYSNYLSCVAWLEDYQCYEGQNQSNWSYKLVTFTKNLTSTATVYSTVGECLVDGEFAYAVNHGCEIEVDANQLLTPFAQSISVSHPDLQCGSIISADQQIVGESVPISGTDFSLVYMTDRDRARTADSTIQIPVTSIYTSPQTTSINVTVKYDGQTDTYTYPNTPGLLHTFTWNGKTRAGVSVQGTMPVEVNVQEIPDRGFIPGLLNKTFNVGGWDASFVGLGGWTLSVYHFYDFASGRLFKGDGSSKKATAIAQVSGNFLVVDQDTGEVFLFDSNGRHFQTLNSWMGSVKYSFEYDSQGRLSAIQDAYGKRTVIQRDVNGVLTGIQAPYGQVTKLVLNIKGKLATIENPVSGYYRMTYVQSNQLLKTFTNPLGLVTTMTYDQYGKLISDVHSSGVSTTLSNLNAMDPSKSGIVSTSATGLQTQYEIYSTGDEKDLYLRIITSPDRNVAQEAFWPDSMSFSRKEGTLTYSLGLGADDPRFPGQHLLPDNEGYYFNNDPGFESISYDYQSTSEMFNPTQYQVAKTVNGTDYSTTTYTNSNQTFTSVSAEGRTSSYQIDNNERMTSLQNPGVDPVSFSYRPSGEISTLAQSARVTQMNYDVAGNLSQVIDPMNHVSNYYYDKAGRLIREAHAGLTTKYEYDKIGNLTALTTPSGNKHQFFYTPESLDKQDLPPVLPGITDPSTYYQYNTEKRISQITKPDGVQINFNYASSSGSRQSWGTGVEQYIQSGPDAKPDLLMSPDLVANALTYADPDLSNDRLSTNKRENFVGSVNISFNNYLKISEIQTTDSTEAVTSNAAYTYDKDQLLTQAGDEVITRDPASGRIASTTLKNLAETYSYNNFGEITGYTIKKGTRILYDFTITRDGIGRISLEKEKVQSATKTYHYTYDNLQRLKTLNINGVLASSNTYDKDSNKISGQIRGVVYAANYDGQDRLSTWNNLSYAYDANGNLTSATDMNTSQATLYFNDSFNKLKRVQLPDGTYVDYQMDGLGRRASRSVNGHFDRYYEYQNQTQLTAEVSKAKKLLIRYVYGTKPNVPDYMIRSGVTYKIISDSIGSVKLVVNATSGNVLQAIDYNEWGQVISDTNPGFQSFGFAGGIYDSTTKLLLFGARNYDPQTGRWLTKDPIGFGGGDANLYRYVMNDPVNFVDPFGLWYAGVSYGGSASIGYGFGGGSYEYGSYSGYSSSGGVTQTTYRNSAGGPGLIAGGGVGGSAALNLGWGSGPSGNGYGFSISIPAIGSASFTIGSGGLSLGYSNGFGWEAGINAIKSSTEVGGQCK